MPSSWSRSATATPNPHGGLHAALRREDNEYLDYDEMVDRADIEAVFILTAPGTHVPFAQGRRGRQARPDPEADGHDDGGGPPHRRCHPRRGHEGIVEPSSNTLLDPDTALIRYLVKQGVLGDVTWFSLGWTGPTTLWPRVGQQSLWAGRLLHPGQRRLPLRSAPRPYPDRLGAGSVQERLCQGPYRREEGDIDPEKYDEFLAGVTDPDGANYWDVVLDLHTQHVQMEAVDQAYSL